MNKVTRFTITVDDEDAAQAPEAPWTALMVNAAGDGLASGCGATAHAAVLDMLRDWQDDEHGDDQTY